MLVVAGRRGVVHIWCTFGAQLVHGCSKAIERPCQQLGSQRLSNRLFVQSLTVPGRLRKSVRKDDTKRRWENPTLSVGTGSRTVRRLFVLFLAKRIGGIRTHAEAEGRCPVGFDAEDAREAESHSLRYETNRQGGSFHRAGESRKEKGEQEPSVSLGFTTRKGPPAVSSLLSTF